MTEKKTGKRGSQALAPGRPRVVVLGGGNGTSNVLSSLVSALKDKRLESLHALVHMADDGGSTGRLRQQYDVGAVGDLTRCMLALSRLRGDIRGEKFLRALEHRFADGDFSGHTLRNALLAALEITSDLDAAIATFARILQIPKNSGVVPTTLRPLTQRVEVRTNGATDLLGEGQHFISWKVDLQRDPAWKPGDVRVSFAEKDVSLNPRAKRILKDATHIIVAPGHTYGTILPTLASVSLDPTFSLNRIQARFIVVMTLLTTPQQTVGWTGEDFVRVYESYLGRPVDVVIANSGQGDISLVSGQGWVSFVDTNHTYQLLQENLVSTQTAKPQDGDVIPRAVAVHDIATMTKVFERIWATAQ